MLDPQPDAGSHHRKHQSQSAARRPQQEQAEHGKDGGDGVENDHHLAMRKTHLQQFVVDMLAIGSENRATADQPPQDGKQRFQNRQSERDHWDGHSHEGRRFLRPCQSQGAEHETDEQAARVTQENRGRIEVKAKKSQDGAGESHAHQGPQPGMIDQRHDKNHHRRKQG